MPSCGFLTWHINMKYMQHVHLERPIKLRYSFTCKFTYSKEIILQDQITSCSFAGFFMYKLHSSCIIITHMGESSKFPKS